MTGALTPLGHHGGGYPMETGASSLPATLTERLEHEKGQITARLEKINGVLSMLEKNPEIGQTLDMISELGGF